MNKRHYILIIVFVTFISFPLINNFIAVLPDISSNENRRIKSFPDLKNLKFENISAALEDYLNDNISVRNRFIFFYNHLNVFVFRSSPVLFKAMVGKSGWYFMTGEEIKTFTGTELFTDEELERFTKEFSKRQQIIEKNNGKLFFAIVPNKSNIYSEYMPDHVIRSNTKPYGKQLFAHLQEKNIPMIDLYLPLTDSKKEYETYYKTDNHWNDFGAFTAVNAILKEFKKVNDHVVLLDQKQYPVVKEKDEPGNIAKMFSIEKEITEYNFKPTPINGFKTTQQQLNMFKAPKDFVYADEFELTRSTGNDSLPVVLIIRDSFGKKAFPYIAEQCKSCTVIFDDWIYGLNQEIIDSLKPDIVLYLIVENKLKNVIKQK